MLKLIVALLCVLGVSAQLKDGKAAIESFTNLLKNKVGNNPELAVKILHDEPFTQVIHHQTIT
jgi:hypothetical protein